MAEVLYPRDLIRRTYRAIRERKEPDSIDLAIEMIDVRRALSEMPDQYIRIIHAWYDFEGDLDAIAMEMHSTHAVATTTLKSAWNHLYSILNTEPR